jgi:hypothetical protein
MTGYLFRAIPVALRFGFIVAGVGLLLPDQISAYAAGSDILGAIGGALLIGYEVMLRRRDPVAAAESPGAE